MRALLLRLLSLSLCLIAFAASADSPVPSALEPWRAWVMRGQEFRACPLIAQKRASAAEDFVCAWPGVLHIDADANGAAIEQRWHVEAESWVPLPGDLEHWPQQVGVDGQPAPVVDHQGPALWLTAGNHQIRARIPWNERPESLFVPPSIGLISLTVDGRTIPADHRENDYITLGRGAASQPEADNLSLQVFRKLTDGIPAELTTVIEWHVSGRAREEVLGPALPEGFDPLSIESEWPARLDGDGRLHVQVQPGDTTLELAARAVAPLAKVVARVPPAPWPKQEIWSYASAPALRITSASSALQVDPQQAGVVEDWQKLPAFALGDGAEISIEERSRGLAEDDKNRLTLDREMWLDFAGDGWFARDRVGGEMVRGWRFDVLPPFRVERAQALNSSSGDRKDESLLVTQGSQNGSTGIEWRTPKVDLGAGVRIDATDALPVAGWQDSFDRVTTTLHLPSGYKLLGAPGADSAAGSWMSSWTLLDVFVAAIVALLAWRLFGLVGAALAIAYLAIGYQESGAPLWTLLFALAFGLVVRALPQGRLAIAATWLRRAALLLLVLVALPFAADELRYALHPQLENAGMIYAQVAAGGFGEARDQKVMLNEAPPPPPASAPVPSRVPDLAKAKDDDQLETITVTGSDIRRKDVIDHYQQSTVVQTGAGEPSWNVGSTYVLSWSGPVLPAQSVRLVVAPPWLVRVLRVALVALLVLLIVRLVRGGPPALARATALAGVLALSSIAVPAPADAQSFPPNDLLDALRTRLVETPACVPSCAALARAEVSARGDEIRIALEAHAAARVAFPVPSGDSALALRGVTVDGSAQDGLARDKGVLEVALGRGVHRIELVYAASADKVALKFPASPKRIEIAVDGWQASGVSEGRLLTETLALTRLREAGASSPEAGAQQFAPFVRVRREITLGNDWSISTNVERLAPKEGGFIVNVPLLAAEHVTSSSVKTDGSSATVAIVENNESAGWASTLDKSDTLTLTAPALSDRAEVWRVVASPMWHLESSGVPVAAPVNEDEGDYRRFEFDPLPGETLTLHISRPAAAEGATRAIDHASLLVSAGQRASDSVLDLVMRATQGGEQAIRLPAGAEVMSVTRNGEAMNLRPRDGTLSLPLVPGSQQFQIRFREDVAAALATRTPNVALGLPAANIDLNIDLPADRWLLATSGPAQGPAVLYWSALVVMLLVAWALARTRRTPLTFVQWALLGIGFSTFSWIALLPVVAWLFALDWRARGASPKSPVLFDLAQIGLALLTLIALVCLVGAIPQGLLGTPDMHVAGNGSTAQALHWFADRSNDALPSALAISVPLWIYKVAMLAWAIWLANAVIGWLRYGFAAWMRDGYWRAQPPKPIVEVPAAAPPPVGRS